MIRCSAVLTCPWRVNISVYEHYYHSWRWFVTWWHDMRDVTLTDGEDDDRGRAHLRRLLAASSHHHSRRWCSPRHLDLQVHPPCTLPTSNCQCNNDTRLNRGWLTILPWVTRLEKCEEIKSTRSFQLLCSYHSFHNVAHIFSPYLIDLSTLRSLGDNPWDIIVGRVCFTLFVL